MLPNLQAASAQVPRMLLIGDMEINTTYLFKQRQLMVKG